MRRLPAEALALGLYALAAVTFTWPLAAGLASQLPGDPGGDTGVYVWNLWVFARAWRTTGFPLTTDAIFPLTGGADLSLHNYSIASNLVALPLLGAFGPVGAYNLVLLSHMTLAGFGAYVLCRHLTGDGLSAWVAGMAFAFSPVLTARAGAHLSLVAAAPLPLFAWAILRALESPRWVAWAACAGGMMAWAAYSDAYYGVYCVVLLTVIALHGGVSLAPKAAPVRMDPAGRALLGIAAVAALGGLIVITTGGTSFTVAGRVVHARTPYTLMGIATACAGLALAWQLAPRLRWSWALDPRRLAGITLTVGSVAAAALSPWLLAIARRAVEGRGQAEPVYWRSSPAGLDALALLLPNPSNPLWADLVQPLLRAWRPDAIPEHVGSLSLVALVIVVGMRVRTGHWAQGATLWVTTTLVAVALSLGPFLTIAGVNTGVPGPWSLLRYVPVIGWARSPSRFAVLATLGLSVLLAFALRDLLTRRRRWPVAGAVTLALAVELSPVPRTLHAATLPSLYRIVAEDPDPSVRVLELPVGVRDGTTSLGNFRTRTQFYQVTHGKPIVGGYLSRVSETRRRRTMKQPTMRALIKWSAGEAIDPQLDVDARLFARRFIVGGRIGYVVIDVQRAGPRFRQWAIEALELQWITTSNGYELYRPAAWPPPDPLPSRYWQTPSRGRSKPHDTRPSDASPAREGS